MTDDNEIFEDWHPENIILELLRINLNNIKEYIQTFSSTLDENLINFEKNIDDMTNKLLEDQKQELYEVYHDDYWRFKDIFPDLFWNSIFLLTYSYFESQLNQLCKYYSNYKGFQLKINEINRQSILNVKKIKNK